VENLLFVYLLPKNICEKFIWKFSSFQLLNEPGMGVGINPGKALTPFPSSIG